MHASNSLPIGRKTISYCQKSHMRIIVNQSLYRIKFYWQLSHNLPSSSEALKSLNSSKSHRLLDFVLPIRPSFLSVMLFFFCGFLWVKNETTNERLIAQQSGIDYLPFVKRVSFERMTHSSTKVTLKDLYKKMWTQFSEGVAHTSGKMLHEQSRLMVAV